MRQCATCGGDIEPDREGHSSQCKRCSRKGERRRSAIPPPTPPEPVPPLQGLAWLTADLLPIYERVCAVYGPSRVGAWLREVYTDPTHPTLALKVDAMTLTVTSADEMAPWWQEASRQLPGGSQARVWMLAGQLAAGGRPAVLRVDDVLAEPEPPTIPQRGDLGPVGPPLPPSFLELTDGRLPATVTPLRRDHD